MPKESIKLEISCADLASTAIINARTRLFFGGCQLLICPGCGLLVPDFDGFGILDHLDHGASEVCKQLGIQIDNYPQPCGYCSHYAKDGDECTVCGEMCGSDGYARRCLRNGSR